MRIQMDFYFLRQTLGKCRIPNPTNPPPLQLSQKIVKLTTSRLPRDVVSLYHHVNHSRELPQIGGLFMLLLLTLVHVFTPDQRDRRHENIHVNRPHIAS